MVCFFKISKFVSKVKVKLEVFYFEVSAIKSKSSIGSGNFKPYLDMRKSTSLLKGKNLDALEAVENLDHRVVKTFFNLHKNLNCTKCWTTTLNAIDPDNVTA